MNAGEISYELKQTKKLWEGFKDNHFKMWAQAMDKGAKSEAERQAGMVTALTQCIGGIDSLIRRIDGK